MEYSAATVSEMVKRVLAELGTAPTAQPQSVPAAPSVSAAPAAGEIPVGISNRHIHLSKADLETLFGAGYELTPMKELSQPGQYACKETLTLLGPSMRCIENVRVLGPLRKTSQVEISKTDSFTLKVKPPVRESGKTEGSAPVIIVGPKGIVSLTEGCIIANRHIHLTPQYAAQHEITDGDWVDVVCHGKEKTTKFYDVQIRVRDDFNVEMHIDTDDANSAGLRNGDMVTIIKK